MNKVETFENEIDLIEDCILNDFAQYCIEQVPDYFFIMPASTTGKFHPAYSLGEGGLVRHTKAAVKIANDLLNLEQNKELVEYRDEIIFALIFHDSIKKGNANSKYTVTEHPLLAANFICCRFAHYLKCIVRDKIGSFREREDMQRWLNDWIMNYVDGDPANSSQDTKARKPLAAAEVYVEEVEDNPGYYTSKFFLRPHYQLEGLTVSLRLVSKLPSVKEAGGN